MKRLNLASEGLLTRKPERPERPFRLLALGIMLQAFKDLLPQEKKPKKPSTNRAKKAAGERRIRAIEWQQDALNWFLSDENGKGSFIWVCRELTFDVEEMREWVLQIKDLSPEERRAFRKRLRMHIH